MSVEMLMKFCSVA